MTCGGNGVCVRERIASLKQIHPVMYGKNGKCEIWGEMACVCKDCLSRKGYTRCHIEKCAKWESVTCGTRSKMCERLFRGIFLIECMTDGKCGGATTCRKGQQNTFFLLFSETFDLRSERSIPPMRPMLLFDEQMKEKRHSFGS